MESEWKVMESDGLNRVWSHQSAPNRFGVDIGMYPMLRGLAQLQIFAENEHFYCAAVGLLSVELSKILLLETV